MTIRANKLTNKLAKLVSITLLTPLLMGSTFYRWVDANGVVNYAQQQPRNLDAEELDTRNYRTNVVARIESESQRPTEAPLTDEQRAMIEELERSSAESEAQLAEVRKENCEKSRRVLHRLQASNRLRVRSRDGTERVVGEDERQQRIADAKDGIVANCDGPATS